MNKADRKLLAEAIAKLQEANGILDGLATEEQEKFDNMPEGLQQADNGQAIETAANTLRENTDNVETAIQELEGIA